MTDIPSQYEDDVGLLIALLNADKVYLAKTLMEDMRPVTVVMVDVEIAEGVVEPAVVAVLVDDDLFAALNVPEEPPLSLDVRDVRGSGQS